MTLKRSKAFGVLLLAALLLSAVAATVASAEPPEYGRCLKTTAGTGKFSDTGCTKAVTTAGKFEWTPGVVRSGFTISLNGGTIATLETVKGTKVTCTSESGAGEYVGTKEILLAAGVKFTGCKTSGLKCSSKGAAPEEIVTNALTGHLQFENKAAQKAVNELVPTSASLLAEFDCNGFAVEVRKEATGGLLNSLAVNKMLHTVSTKYSAASGEQKPSEYENAKGEKVVAGLESSAAGGAFEETGLTLTATHTNEEAVETRTAAPPTTETPCPEPAVLDEEGKVVLPSGAESEGETSVDEEEGKVSTLFPSFETSLDTWYPKEPCDPSIGGAVPAAAREGGSEEKAVEAALQEEGITASREEVEKELGKIGGEIAGATTSLGTKGVPPSPELPEICPGKNSKKNKTPPCSITPGGAPPLDPSKPFGGRDIIFVHGFQQAPFGDELKNKVVVPEWPAERSPFYAGYWKEHADAYWKNHIEQHLGVPFFESNEVPRPGTNRYMIVAWAPTQRLFVGAHAMLTQISDAMQNGTGVISATGTKGFCEKGCVIVSHSTGGPLTDVAMSLADKSNSGPLLAKYGNLTFISKHVRAHVALHGAFSGSGIATPAVAFGLGLLPAAGGICKLGVKLINLLISESGQEVTGCGGIAKLSEVIPRSVLVDLMPPVMQSLWGRTMASPAEEWINRTPIATLIVAGGHPTSDGVDTGGAKEKIIRPIMKILLYPGFDDGVLAMNSQCATFDSASSWPSGYEPTSSPPYFKVFDMGVSTARAIGFYVAQVIDPFVHKQTPRIAGGCIPFLSPDGMRQPWASGTSTENRYNRHYSFLQSVSDHFVGPLNSSLPRYDTVCYLSTDPEPLIPKDEPEHHCSEGLPYPGHEDNAEEVRVITNAHVYQAPITCPASGYFECGSYKAAAPCPGGGPECSSLLNTSVKTLVTRYIRGRKITFKLFGKRHTWWIWQRKYDLLGSWETWTENDYIYSFVLR